MGVAVVRGHEFQICRSSSRDGIADLQLEHEAVNLRFGQRISAFLLDGILRGQHQKRFLELEGLFADGDLLFLHGFEQGALHLGRRAVDFVGQHEVGEDRAFARGEAAGLRIVNLRADDVGRQHVRRELQAGELHVDARCASDFHRECFGQAGHAFEQHVAVGQQADDQPLDQIFLADDDFADFVEQRRHKRAGFLDGFVNCVNSCAHRYVLYASSKKKPENEFGCAKSLKNG